MICKKIFYYLPFLLLFLVFSCTSTKTEIKEIPVEETVLEKEEVVPPIEEKEEIKIEEPKEEIIPEVTLPKESPDVVFVKALEKCLKNDDRKGAIELFNKLPEGLRNDVELRFLEASLLYSDSQFDKAIEVCNIILSIDPTHKDTFELLSYCYKQKGDKIAASKLNDKILKVDPYNPSVNIQKAEEQVLRKRWKSARSLYQRALNGDPNNIDALFGYAKMSYYCDDLDTAEEYLGKILDLDPTNVSALAYMGTIQFDRENYLRAAQFVEIALQLDPNNSENLLDYGTYLRYLGKYEEAIEAWKKSIALEPSYFLPYAYVAGIYDQVMKDYEKALSYYYKVIELNPKYFYAYENIALLEYHLGNYEQAAMNFQAAYSFRNTYDYALMTAACYMKMGKETEAKNVLMQQMKLLPDHNSTEYALVRFYYDTYNNNAYNSLTRKVNAEKNSNVRGKYTFYLGLYNELNGSDKVAEEYYTQVTSLQAPMFFEYRLAEWGLGQK